MSGLRLHVKIIFIKNCTRCNQEYDDREDNIGMEKICLKCNTRQLKNSDCKFNAKLCDNLSCRPCFERSLASHKRAKYWNLTKNENISPRKLTLNAKTNYWFECDDCGHDFRIALYRVKQGRYCSYCRNFKRCDRPSCKFCFDHSFASHEKAKYWHLTKNGNVKPRDVPPSANKKYWFHCEDCGHDFHVFLNHIQRGVWCGYCSNQMRCDEPSCKPCFERSFDSVEKSRHWHPTKNGNIRPRNVAKSSGTEYWFHCEDCGHDFCNTPVRITRGIWCEYCAHLKRCNQPSCKFCFDNSFAGSKKSKCWHPTKNGNVKPRDVALNTSKNYWFICEYCKHDIYVGVSHIQLRDQCKYCINLQRCDELSCKFCFEHSFASHEKSESWHPTKNGNVKPRDVAARSNNKYWFVCKICQHDINITLSDVQVGKWCKCRKHKTESKFRDFLCSNFHEIIYQFKADFCLNPETGKHFLFDFCIPSLKIIVEVDGPQHFRDMPRWHSSVKNNRERDIYKMKMANDNGYSVIRIVQDDVWRDTYDWKNDVLTSVEKCRENVRNVFCSGDESGELYNFHQTV